MAPTFRKNLRKTLRKKPNYNTRKGFIKLKVTNKKIKQKQKKTDVVLSLSIDNRLS
jgi:hypothetical protein